MASVGPMTTQRQAAAARTWMRLLPMLLLALAMLGMPCRMAVAADESSESTSAKAASSDQAARLAAFMVGIESRQVGQPGNDKIDQLVRERFEALVKANNDPQRQARADELLAAAAVVDKQLAEITNDPKNDLTSDAVIAAGMAALQADSAASDALAGMWQSGRVGHLTAVFVPGRSELSVSDGGKARLYQLAPNLVEPANLPVKGFTGPLVYVGLGSQTDLSGKDLQGAVVLMEFPTGKRWISAVQLGASAVIFLEPSLTSDSSWVEAAQKRTNSLLSVPRFYLKRSDLTEALGEDWQSKLAARPAATLTGEPGRWERRKVYSDWLLIPGAVAPKKPGTPIDEDVGRQLVHLQTYKDSASIVPELAPGARSAASLMLLLDLVDDLRRNRPDRPVLVSVVNDHCNAMMGEQEFGFAAFVKPEAIITELTATDRDTANERFVHEFYSQTPTSELTESMRSLETKVWGQPFKNSKPIVDRLTMTRNPIRVERTRLAGQLLVDSRRRKDGKGELLTDDVIKQNEKRIKEIDVESHSLAQLQQLFNRFGRKTRFDQLTEDQRKILFTSFSELSEQAGRFAEQMRENRELLMSNLAMRRRMMWLTETADEVEPKTWAQAFARRHRALPGIMGVVLDLSFVGEKLGFFHVGHMRVPNEATDDNDKQRVYRLAVATLLVAEEYSRTTGAPNLLEDTIRMARGLPWEAHVGSRSAFGSSVMNQYLVPGLTLAAVRDACPLDFTPQDGVDEISPDRLETATTFARGYLPRLINSPSLAGTRVNRGAQQPMSVEVSIRAQDDFATSIPQKVMPNVLIVGMANSPAGAMPTNASMIGQVHPWPIVMSDGRGGAMFRSPQLRGGGAMAFGYDADYRVMGRAVDLGESEKRFNSLFQAGFTTPYLFKPVVVSVFEKVDLIGLTAPASLAPIPDIEVIDGLLESQPRHFSVVGVGVPLSNAKAIPRSGDGTGSLMVEPEATFKLKIGGGLAINADVDHPQGKGYPAKVGRLSNLVLTGAQDMYLLTSQRLNLLSAKGVKNDTAVRFNNEAGEIIESLKSVRGTPDANERLLAGSEQARGLAFQGYGRALGTINDLIKAVVIFLALVIPFCFFVTKLISPFTDVNRQLAMFVGVFVLMAATLRFLHPAFEVAKTPEVVILAFVIMGLAAFVASVLIGRFNTSMTQVVEESLQAESVDAPQSRLAGVAFLVGVNNMKRRRIRTSLTCATVVLVTFTMLSVISVGQDVEPAMIRLGPETNYSGFLYANPGLSQINAFQIQRLRAQYAGKAQVVSRAWAQRLGENQEYQNYLISPLEPQANATVSALEVKVLVGLETREEGFLGPLPIVPGGKWFSTDSAAEVVLSVKAAQFMGLTPENSIGKTLLVAGRKLKLVALLDDANLEAIRDLAEAPLLPLLVPPTQKGPGGVKVTEVSSDGGGGLASGPGVEIARTVDVAFVPIELARSLGEAEYRSLSVKYVPATADDAGAEAAAKAAWDDANQLVKFHHARISVGLVNPVPRGDEPGLGKVDPGQYALSSSSSTEVGGLIKVAIPIILAATIILNTMLGSVMERRREVAIYNAIGLNPGHVMMFFLAESLVFGLVGSVAGYLIGQGLSLLLTRLNLPLNLNYSSLSVMVVIFLTIATVLLSTVYPALMAARAAVPSGQRRWSLPQPDGDQIHVKFPFSYDAARVLGVCAYLRDYMKQNSEASTGKFLARIGPVGRVAMAAPSAPTQASAAGAPTGDDQRGYAMVFDIAPAPFDLGVNQKMEVYAYYDPRVRAHMLAVHLTRLSGERGNWMTVNQPFLETLRKRLLGWRSQRPETHEAYYREGEKLFGDAPNLPVVAGNGSPGTVKEHA